MKKGTKKLVAALFAAAMLAAVIPAGVNASQKKIGKCGEKAYATYDASTKTVYIKGSGEMNDYNIEQAPWAQKNVRKVVIGNKITSIGDAAFFQSPLDSIKISNSVKTIGKSAFCESALENVTIPKSVTKIKTMAFSGCSELTEIKVDSKNKKYSAKDGVLFNKKKSTLIMYPAGKKGNTYRVPSSVKTIAAYSFDGYPGQEIYAKIKKLIMPKNIREIKGGAFYGVTIKTIEFPGKRPDKMAKDIFSDTDKVTIRYKASKWPVKFRKNYGAKKLTWKKY